MHTSQATWADKRKYTLECYTRLTRPSGEHVPCEQVMVEGLDSAREWRDRRSWVSESEGGGEWVVVDRRPHQQEVRFGRVVFRKCKKQ